MVHHPQVFIQTDEFIIAATSFLLCILIVLFGRHVERLGGHGHHLSAVQATHSQHTPLVGGIAVFGALALSLLFVPVDYTGRYGQFLLAVGLLFFVGLLEDVGLQVSARKRLLASVVASLVAMQS